MPTEQQNPNTPTPGTALLAMASEAAEMEQRIIAAAQAKEGEIDPVLEGYLNDIQQNIATKIDSYKFVMDRLDVAAELLERQADMFAMAARSISITVESMKARIKSAMVTMNAEEIKGTMWRFKMSTNPKGRLEIDLPTLKEKSPNFVKLEQVPREYADKDAIKTALDIGEAVPGASYQPVHTLRQYVVKG